MRMSVFAEFLIYEFSFFMITQSNNRLDLIQTIYYRKLLNMVDTIFSWILPHLNMTRTTKNQLKVVMEFFVCKCDKTGVVQPVSEL